MNELTRTGSVGFYVKGTQELRDALRKYGVDVSAVARQALAAEALRRAGQEAMAKRNEESARGRS